MKKLLFICIFTLVSAFGSPLLLAAEGKLLHGQNTIDNIDTDTRDLVIGDQVYGTADNVLVHSEFVKDDYFSRLRVGMKVRFTYRYYREIRKKIINEIWVLRN